MRKLTALALCTAFVVGCASAGHQLDMSSVDRLTPGVSTIKDAVAVLGRFSSETVTNGIHGYGWTYVHTNGFTLKTDIQSVLLIFDRDGKLKSKSNTSTHSGTENNHIASVTQPSPPVVSPTPAQPPQPQVAASPLAPVAQINAWTAPPPPDPARAVGATFGPSAVGLGVLKVEKGGVAARAGLRAGDVITHIGGRMTTPLYWENAAALLTTSGKSVVVRIYGGEETTLNFEK